VIPRPSLAWTAGDEPPWMGLRRVSETPTLPQHYNAKFPEKQSVKSTNNWINECE